MPHPDNFILDQEIFLNESSSGIVLSNEFSSLLKGYRESYSWPKSLSSSESQTICLNLEEDANTRKNALTPDSAHEIALLVSQWAGNNLNAHKKLESVDKAAKEEIMTALRRLMESSSAHEGVNDLSKISGISLVIATKIFRFLSPGDAAAVDRHTSYFFNSLNINSSTGTRNATEFKREWANGRHKSSRMANYSPPGLQYNLEIYLNQYLPLLNNIADSLNSNNHFFQCAATNHNKCWRSTDIEMAIYDYMASNKNLPR